MNPTDDPKFDATCAVCGEVEQKKKKDGFCFGCGKYVDWNCKFCQTHCRAPKSIAGEAMAKSCAWCRKKEESEEETVALEEYESLQQERDELQRNYDELKKDNKRFKNGQKKQNEQLKEQVKNNHELQELLRHSVVLFRPSSSSEHNPFSCKKCEEIESWYDGLLALEKILGIASTN